MFGFFKSLFGSKQPAKQPRQRYALTLGDLVVLELQKGGDGTALEIARRLNANPGSVGNVMSQLANEKKVRRADKRGREIVWSLV